MKDTNEKNLSYFVSVGDLDGAKEYLKTANKQAELQKNENGRNALYYAVFNGDVNIVRALIDFGFDPTDIDDQTGVTALHIAAAEGNFDLVVYLTEVLNLNINALDNKGLTPLYYAVLFLNQDHSGHSMVVSSRHIDVAWELVRKGAKFTSEIFRMQRELLELERVLLRYIHNGVRGVGPTDLEANLNYINFITDAMNYSKLFLKDIIRCVPEHSMFSTDEFKHNTYKIPLAFGWQISKWDYTNPTDTHLVSLNISDMKPAVYDLTKISPLLINLGTDEVNSMGILDSFDLSLQEKFEPSEIKLINIVTNIDEVCIPSNYFSDVVTTTGNQEALQAIIDLSNEIDRRKTLSQSDLDAEKPILCLIDDLSMFITHDNTAYIQNILMYGTAVHVYIVAITSKILPQVIHANFNSFATFQTATDAESKKYIDCPNAVNLGVDELFFVSPALSISQPAHIKLDR